MPLYQLCVIKKAGQFINVASVAPMPFILVVVFIVPQAGVWMISEALRQQEAAAGVMSV